LILKFAIDSTIPKPIGTQRYALYLKFVPHPFELLDVRVQLDGNFPFLLGDDTQFDFLQEDRNWICKAL